MSESDSTILIVGGGPVGMFLALRLAQSQPPIPITVLESSSTIEPTAKAMTHMPAVFTEFKKAGIYDDLVAVAGGLVNGTVCFRRTSDKSVLGASPPNSGKPGPLTVPQHQFCEVVAAKLRELVNVTLLMGHLVKDVKLTEKCMVTAEASSGETKFFTSSYLVGADGSKSTIRRLSGIAFEGETLPRQLVATDVYYPFTSHGWAGGNFMADPEHYGLIGPITAQGLWRVSFAVPIDYTSENIDAALAEKFEAMFPGPRPLEYKVERVAPYRAQQLVAETMKKGRIILIGDAAHLTNPYAGMGLASGLLDASSLADALMSHLQRGADERLLDAWATARRDNFRNIVDPVSRASFWALQDPDIDSLAKRHPILKSLKAGPAAKPPPFATDIEKLKGYVA